MLNSFCMDELQEWFKGLGENPKRKQNSGEGWKAIWD